MSNKYFEVISEMLINLEQSQSENIVKAGEVVASCIMNGGILQAFGSGHSYAAAIEVCGRAGGLIPSKCIIDPAGGIYEMIE
ncbi:SIS domain-containing protein, partial [Clostridium perfringens]|nr:SIS domain-containing protein [Clostridium perfringens]